MLSFTFFLRRGCRRRCRRRRSGGQCWAQTERTASVVTAFVFSHAIGVRPTLFCAVALVHRNLRTLSRFEY